jgi:hypothetical protein
MLTIFLSGVGVAVAAGETVGDGEGLGDEVLSSVELDAAFTVVPANTPKNKNRRMTEIMCFLIFIYLLFMLILGYTVMVTLLDYFVIRMAQRLFAVQNFKANIT